MTTALLTLALLLPHVPVEAEVYAVALALRVDPALALAVAHVESGHVPARLRDRVVSRTDDVGTLQVNVAASWRVFGARSKREWRDALKGRFVNILAGVSILAACVDRCGGQAAVAYNSGKCRSRTGEAYAAQVRWQRERMRPKWAGGRS